MSEGGGWVVREITNYDVKNTREKIINVNYTERK